MIYDVVVVGGGINAAGVAREPRAMGGVPSPLIVNTDVPFCPICPPAVGMDWRAR